VTVQRHIEPDDLALYALQALSVEETATVAEHLRGCARCREEVAALQGDLAALALSSELQTPPAAARQRLLQQIGRERRLASVAEVAPAEPALEGGDRERGHEAGGGRGQTCGAVEEIGRRRGGARALPWLGWAVAAGVTVAAGNLYRQREELRAGLQQKSAAIASLSVEAARGRAVLDALTDRAATRVTLTQTPEPPKPVGRATYVPEKGTLLFVASNLAPLPQDKTYELWLIPADGSASIPAGTFQPDSRGNASVILPEVPKGVTAKAFGVTIENAGGSPTPTLPIVLAGASG
jgi:anti-sigma-K factor RskA